MPLLDAAREALRGGARWFWLRDRDLPDDEREALARDLQSLLGGHARLTVGGDLALALRIGADAHLPAGADLKRARSSLGPGRLLGVSAHDFADVRRAAAAGADYVTLSPIFASASKPGYGPALGPGAIATAAKSGVPIIALGGLTAANAGACLGAGAMGIAVMGGVFGAERPDWSVKAILAALAER